MVKILKTFKDALLQMLSSDNIILIHHHGSRARREPRLSSDYDVSLLFEKWMRRILSKYPNFQVYLLSLLSLQDLEDMPPGQRLQFFEGQKLYGNLNLKLPSREQVLEEIKRIRLESLHYLRHYLILPHDKERKAKLVYHQLKAAYFYLRSIAYFITGNLISNRLELISKLKKLPINQNLAAKLLQTLKYYEKNAPKIAESPDEYLFELEKFFRTTHLQISDTVISP
jgi:hypothetical protein